MLPRALGDVAAAPTAALHHQNSTEAALSRRTGGSGGDKNLVVETASVFQAEERGGRG